MQRLSLKSLLDVQIGTKDQMDEIHDEEDMIRLSLSVMTVHIAKIIPLFAALSLGGKKIKNPTSVIQDLAVVLEYMMIICNSCNFDIPEDVDIKEFGETVPNEVKNDTILTLLGMLGAVSELAHIIYVDTIGFIWEQDELPEDFETNISTIIIGMQNIGIKHGFTMSDIIAELS